jgi:hypothetical protein
MEYQWHGRKSKNGRITVKAPVIHRKEIRKDLFLTELDVGSKLAQDLCRAGSFVFLRGNIENRFFDTPIAVISSDVEKGSIVVAVVVRGAKSKLISKSHDWMYVRGPYWNGLFGYDFIKRTHHSRCLIVLGGISQASGALVANQMINNANEVNVLINSADTIFIEEYFNDRIKIFREAVLNIGWMKLVNDMISSDGISCIYSGGHNRQHELLGALIIESGRSVNLATSNNNILHCGEGICGSCTQNNDGGPLRSCKAQKVNQYSTFCLKEMSSLT